MLAVDLDARALEASAARALMCDASRRFGGEARLFVKIDSTLRGPVSALVRGALEGSRKERAMVAPAFPEHGRVYREGRLVGGASLQEVLGEVAEQCSLVDDPAKAAPLCEGMLAVGSGGLARQLAGAGATLLPRVTGPVLVVAGSPAVETQRQLERLPPDVEVLRTTPTAHRDQGEAASRLADIVAKRWAPPGLVVLTGGETARKVCEAIGVEAIQLTGEVQPGIPIGTFEGGPWHKTVVVTKAGGFGGPDALLDVLRLLSPSSQNIP